MSNSLLIGATMDRDEERRRHERFPAQADALTEFVAGKNIPIVLVNISEVGFKAICTQFSIPGEIISVTIAGYHPIPARIVWTTGKIIGCEFLAPIGQSQLASIIESSPDAI